MWAAFLSSSTENWGCHCCTVCEQQVSEIALAWVDVCLKTITRSRSHEEASRRSSRGAVTRYKVTLRGMLSSSLHKRPVTLCSDLVSRYHSYQCIQGHCAIHIIQFFSCLNNATQKVLKLIRILFSTLTVNDRPPQAPSAIHTCTLRLWQWSFWLLLHWCAEVVKSWCRGFFAHCMRLPNFIAAHETIQYCYRGVRNCFK